MFLRADSVPMGHARRGRVLVEDFTPDRLEEIAPELPHVFGAGYDLSLFSVGED